MRLSRLGGMAEHKPSNTRVAVWVIVAVVGVLLVLDGRRGLLD